MQLRYLLAPMVLGLAGSPCAAVRLEEVGLSIEASNNSVQVSVQIDIESPDAAGKADTAALYTTRCSYNVSHPTSASHSLAAAHNPTASGGIAQLAANATRGFFLNSTGSPSATGSLRVPSQVTLASLSRASYPTLASGSMLARVVAAGCLIFFVPL